MTSRVGRDKKEVVRTLVTGVAATVRRLRAEEDTIDDESEAGSVLGPEKSAYPRVGIVVLTWENLEEARDCLDSLQSVSYPNYRVYLADNGSSDGSIETLEREYDWCSFVRNSRNLGFARGNNPAIERALADDVDYVLLLNDDTVVPETFLTPLVETMERYARVAAVGGVNRNASTGRIHNAGYEFFPSLGAQGVRYTAPREPGPYSVGFVQSSVLLVDPGFLRSIGLLSETYFIGMEDADLAWRAHRRGHRVLVDPRSWIDHRVGTTDEREPFNLYHRTRNRVRFAAEHLSGLRLALFSFSFGVLSVYRLGAHHLRGNDDEVRAVALGLFDGLLDNEFRPYEAFG
jgi:GT2 family glycosyltransferase